jgi:chemotaxis protein histidine kinase CheA
MFDYHHAIAGATITGDGKVHMILDVPFLIKDLSGVIARA